VSATPSDFAAQAPASPVTLAQGQSLDVPVTFSPTATGTRGGTLKVTTAGEGEVTVGLSGTATAQTAKLAVDRPAITFEGTPVGGHVTDAFTISNNGGQPLTINSVGGPAAPFSIPVRPAAGTTLQPNDSVTVEVHYDPTAVGTFSDEIDVDTDAGEATVGVSGTSAAGPHLEVSPLTIDYGDVQVGDVAEGSFTVHNSGSTGATIMRSKPPTGGVFVATSGLDETSGVPPGGSKTLKVEFRPSAAGDASDGWDITANDDSGPQRVTFSGRGIPAPQPETQTSDPEAPPVLLPAIPRAVFAPALTHLRVNMVARRVSFRMSRAAKVSMRIERRVNCASPIGRCFDYVRKGRAWSVRARAGANTFAIPRRRLVAGRYRLVATPAAGVARHTSFRFAPTR
jgi:hypothetical protein